MEKNKMYFIGVTTTKSIINTIFPAWMKLLDSDMILECVDIPMNSNDAVYIEHVNRIKESESILGALVTTHKIPLFNHANHLFDKLEESAKRFEEIGCIYKKQNRLIGEATDILTVKSAFENIWIKENYKSTSNVHVCILGCGGAGVALAYGLLSSDYKNISQVIMVDILAERINNAKKILEPFDVDAKVRFYLSTGVGSNDEIVNSLSDNAFVVNATGVGKDVIGSPVSSNVNFPKDSCVWEYNYRGYYGREIEFLKIAQQQSKIQNISIYDGFDYFLYGWTTVISRILDIDIDRNLFEILAKAALDIYNNK